MKGKKRYILAAGILLYLLLLAGLIISERIYIAGAPDHPSGITTIFNAVWYSLTTLTTVGYGDVTPVSPVGRLIGAIFMLFSMGLLAGIIGSLMLNLRTHILSRILLLIYRNRNWIIFDAHTKETSRIAANLKTGYPKHLILFANTREEETGTLPEGHFLALPAKDLITLRGRKKRAVLIIAAGSSMENYETALSLKDCGHQILCKTEYEPDAVPEGMILFNPYLSCGRLYWKQFPVLNKDERILLIGSGRYASSLLEQGLINNVFASDQHLTYVVYGGADDFSGRRPYLRELFSMEGSAPDRDTLLFRRGEWYEDLPLLTAAHRIIICEDEETKTLEILSRLKRLYPVTGSVHVRLTGKIDGAESFGGVDKVFTPHQLEWHRLSRESFLCKGQGNEDPACSLYSEHTGGPGRRFRLALTDHLEVKARILLGTPGTENGKEMLRRAGELYLTEKQKDPERFLRIEHERWRRFHILNNWRYGPVQDEAKRLHPLLAAFDALPEQDRALFGEAWELLLKAAPAGQSA